MTMPCEYHDPSHVAAISAAIAKSVAMQRAYAVWVPDGGSALHAPLDKSPIDGLRWVINGYVCEEQSGGVVTRRCSLIPVGFRCIWSEA
jgi:hypothetical protein